MEIWEQKQFISAVVERIYCKWLFESNVIYSSFWSYKLYDA